MGSNYRGRIRPRANALFVWLLKSFLHMKKIRCITFFLKIFWTLLATLVLAWFLSIFYAVHLLYILSRYHSESYQFWMPLHVFRCFYISLLSLCKYVTMHLNQNWLRNKNVPTPVSVRVTKITSTADLIQSSSGGPNLLLWLVW